MKKRLGSWVLHCALGASLASAQSAPRLEHGPPWLGQDLALTLIGAPAHAPVRWLESDARGAQSTPYGLLELDRSLLRIAGTGATDGSGRLELVLAIPLDPALAETEAHYQALVADPDAPGGWVLSQALHLRRVGPRLYASAVGQSPTAEVEAEPGELAIVSAVTRELVARVDYGLPLSSHAARSADAQPVLSHDLARGAVVTSLGELRFFDPFFGEVLAVEQLDEASRRLARNAGGTLAIALEPGSSEYGVPLGPARLLAFEFESGALLGGLTLQHSVSRRWLWSPERDEAFLVEMETQDGPFFVRRMGLKNLEDRGAVPLLGSARFVSGLALDGTVLFVSAFSGCGGSTVSSRITRIDYATQPPIVSSSTASTFISGLTPVPALGSLYSFRASLPCFGPGYSLHQSRLEDPVPSRSFMPPIGLGENSPPEAEWDGRRLWLPYPRDTDGSLGLGWFDTLTEQWTHHPHPYGTGPLQVELLRDALVETAALISGDYYGPTFHLESRVHFLNLDTAEREHHVAIRPWIESLLAVPLP